MWSSFRDYEEPVEQRKLREKLHVVVFFRLGKAIQTEKSVINDI